MDTYYLFSSKPLSMYKKPDSTFCGDCWLFVLFNTSYFNVHLFVIQIKKACVSSSVTLFLYLTNVGLPLLFYLEVFPLSQYNSFILKKYPITPPPSLPPPTYPSIFIPNVGSLVILMCTLVIPIFRFLYKA